MKTYKNKELVLNALFALWQNKLTKHAYNEVKCFVSNEQWGNNERDFCKYFEMLHEHDVIDSNEYFAILDLLEDIQ